jgi:cytochrome c oxidase assembly protein subunit 15
MMAVVRGYLSRRISDFRPSPRTCTAAALTALIASAVIVVAGGAVRLTGSGLGCPTWPECGDGSLTPIHALGYHAQIEFANRLLIYALSASVGWLLIVAFRTEPRRPDLRRLAAVQFGLIPAEAVVGGLTVLTKLNPFMVAAHFLLGMVFLMVGVVTWERSRGGTGRRLPSVPQPVAALSFLLVAATGLLLVFGTAVTGTGPHSGDDGVASRMPFPWERTAQLHTDLVFLVCGLTLALLFTLKGVRAPGAATRRTVELCVVLVAQAVIGYWQYFTGLPTWLVGIHVAGACLVWIAALRIPFALREQAVPMAGGDPRSDAGATALDEDAAPDPTLVAAIPAR